MHCTEEYVYKMNFINVCNWLSFYKERDEYQEAIHNKNKGTLTT